MTSLKPYTRERETRVASIADVDLKENTSLNPLMSADNLTAGAEISHGLQRSQHIFGIIMGFI